MIYKAVVAFILDVEGETEACDAISETLRPHLRRYGADYGHAAQSCLLDWGYHIDPAPATQADIDMYCEDEGITAAPSTAETAESHHPECPAVDGMGCRCDGVELEEGERWIILAAHTPADERVYWNNGDGWGDKAAATVFTRLEKSEFNLPMGGAWTTVETAGPAKSTWDDNTVQFPRLLAEIRAVGLTADQYRDLHESMDLGVDDVDELLERAESVWNVIKAPPAAETATPAEPAAYMATFIGQAWINNHSMEVDDGRHTYPVTAAEVAAAGGPDAEDFDELQLAAAAPTIVREWFGPFQIEIEPIA